MPPKKSPYCFLLHISPFFLQEKFLNCFGSVPTIPLASQPEKLTGDGEKLAGDGEIAVHNGFEN